MLTNLRQKRAERRQAAVEHRQERRRRQRCCPRCGFDYLMVWTETVTLIEPPEWWDLPWELYQPEPFVVRVRFCTRCGKKEEFPVGDSRLDRPESGPRERSGARLRRHRRQYESRVGGGR